MTRVNSIALLTDPSLRKKMYGDASEGEILHALKDVMDCFPTPEQFKNLCHKLSKGADEMILMESDRSINQFTPKFIFEEGGAGLTKTIDTFHENRGGAVYSVEREVSDALWMSDVKDDGSFDELKWLAPSIHVSYEKSDKNSILVQRVSRSQLISLLQECEFTPFDIPALMCMDKIWRDDELLGRDDNMILWRVEQNTKKGFLPVRMGWFNASASFRDIRHNYLKEDFNINNCNNFHVWIDNQPDKNCAIDKREESIDDLERVFKTMAYASTQYARPQSVTKDKKARNKMKKNGVRVPNKGGIFRVVDLPMEIKARLVDEYKKGKSKSHNWENGRRAHFRYFRDDCFVNMKGKWIWIPPILDKDGKLPKWKGKVRKRRKGARRLQLS